MNTYKQYIVPIILIIAILATATGYFFGKEKYDNFGKLEQFNKEVTQSDYKVLDAPAEYFGSLAELTNVDSAKQEKTNLANSRSLSSAGSASPIEGSADKQTSTTPGVEPGVLPVEPDNGIGDTPDILPPIEEYPYYTFKYSGEDFSNLLSDNQPVYKRSKLTFNDRSITSLLSSYSFGLINLSRLGRVKLQNFSIIEDSENFDQAVNVYVDAMDQTISLYQNGGYEVYEDAHRAEKTEEYTQPSQTPSSEIIQNTNDFLAKFNVSLSGYGQPQIDQGWLGNVSTEDVDSPRYYPPIIDIIYPYVIEGQESLDEGANLAGLRVSYNTYTQQVIAINDLRIRQYQRSTYPGEIRLQQIVSLAERGGFRNYQYPEPNMKKITLELGTPEVKMMRMWQYNNRISEEVFVPTLVFPIINRGDYWRKSIMVPLVKEILENEDYQPPVYPLGQSSSEDLGDWGE